MYIREVIQVETNANNQYPNLEIVTITLRFGSFKSCLSLCYRPPSSTVEFFNDLTGYLELVNLTQFSNYILLGDFNVDMASASSSWYDKMTELANTFCLTQVVSEITHVHHNGTATLIDQVFMSNVQLLQKCSVVPPLGNSDHRGIHLQIQWKTKSNNVNVTAERIVWRYAYADWEKACEQINATDWNSLLADDVDKSWFNWHHQFMQIMKDCIP